MAVLSTEAKDRDGDIIRQAGWQLDNFMAHPVLVANHNYFDLLAQIGEWEDIKVIKGNRPRTEGVAKYYIDDGNEQADWGYKLAQRGRAAYSVGFLPDMDKASPLDGNAMFGGYEFKGQEMLETSQVVVPSNHEALQRAKAKQLHPVTMELIDELLADAPEPETKAPDPWDEDAFIEKLIVRFRADIVAAAAEEFRRQAAQTRTLAKATEAGLALALKEYRNGR